RARFESIIGAPVRSRSSLTSVAEISAIGPHLLRLLLLRGRFGDRLFARRDLFVVAFRDRFLWLGFGCRLRPRRAVRGGTLELAGRHLLLPGVDPVRDHPDDPVT